MSIQPGELNEYIINKITNELYRFCMGEYEKENKYTADAVVLVFQAGVEKMAGELNMEMSKNELGVINSCVISVNNIEQKVKEDRIRKHFKSNRLPRSYSENYKPES
jgi:hypothetical protein